MFRKWLHGLLVGLLIGAVFVAVPGAQNYIWSSINGVPYATSIQLGRGTATSPSVRIGGTTAGLFAADANNVCFASGDYYASPCTNGYQFRIVSIGQIGWTADSQNGNTAFDLQMTREATAILQLGLDVNGAAVAQTIKAHDGITGTDIAGANLTLAGGRGTGAGAPGQVIFQTSTALGSGTTAQTLATRLIIDANGYVTVGTSAGTGANRLYASGYYAGTTAGVSGTYANVTTVGGIVTAGTEPLPDPLTQDEVNELRGLLAAARTR